MRKSVVNHSSARAALLAVSCAVAAPSLAQRPPPVRSPQAQVATPDVRRPYVVIPLKDESGTVRALMGFVPRGGLETTITFSEPDGRVLNQIRRTTPIPPVAEGQRVTGGGGGRATSDQEGRSDNSGSIKKLQDQIDLLRASLNDVIRRVNGR